MSVRLSPRPPAERMLCGSTCALLAEVEITLSLSPQRDLARIQEVHSLHPRHAIHTDPAKGAQAIFLSEFLAASCRRHRLPDDELYDYISSSLVLWEGLSSRCCRISTSASY